MTKRFHLVFLCVLTFTFLSCNNVTPAGFWKNYNKRFLIKNISDQGPFGGHRALYWKSNDDSIFAPDDILTFATANGWKLTDSLAYQENQTTNWSYFGKPIFPLDHRGFSDTTSNNSTFEYFPRWFGGKLKVYKFRTGWITVEPGTDNTVEENGFILVNSRRNEMAVYHLWGE